MKETKPIILFDGICNLCNAAVGFILKKDMKKQFCFVPLQSEEGQKLIGQYQIRPETDSVILIRKGLVFIESEAAIGIGKLLPAPWKWAGVFRIIPLKIRNGIYRLIARNRNHWFGKRTTCRVIRN